MRRVRDRDDQRLRVRLHPDVRAWSFPVSGGLYANTAPTVVTGRGYSISMLTRYNPMDSGYARLIDF